MAEQNKIKSAQNIQPVEWGSGKPDEQEIPKMIWTFWDAPKISPLINMCFSQIKKNLPDYELNIIHLKNVRKYIPNIEKARTDISFINFTDLVRLKLLKKYGGIWMDASILLTENLDWILNKKYESGADLVGFYSDYFTKNSDFPLLETWFLACAPENKFISAWASEFEKCYNSENPHQYFDEEKKNPDFLHKFDEWLSNYLIAYLAAAKVMRANQDFKLLMFPSSKTAHYYTFGLELPAHKTAELFLSCETQKHIPKMIKFERISRNAVDNAIENGLLTKKSLLFRITKNKNYLRRKPRFFIKYIIFISRNLAKKYLHK
ncbi:MAG: capsular polysaccharide synthesis protein [Flavobacteriaceae bacterium]|jgi:hypothetical protein|nr:capsular polysaccharide synthesis protein [Flavobacteriaceae bacterium]